MKQLLRQGCVLPDKDYPDHTSSVLLSSYKLPFCHFNLIIFFHQKPFLTETKNPTVSGQTAQILWDFLYLCFNSNQILHNTLCDHSSSTGFQCLCGFCPLLYIIGILPSKIISVLSGLSPIYALFKYSDEQKPVRLPYAFRHESDCCFSGSCSNSQVQIASRFVFSGDCCIFTSCTLNPCCTARHCRFGC